MTSEKKLEVGKEIVWLEDTEHEVKERRKGMADFMSPSYDAYIIYG